MKIAPEPPAVGQSGAEDRGLPSLPHPAGSIVETRRKADPRISAFLPGDPGDSGDPGDPGDLPV